jgi:hypothetical protein
MTDYTVPTIRNIPTIHVGRGSSTFFCNIIRSYLKNHTIVRVVAKAERINLSVWVISQLSDEYFISDMYVGHDMQDISFAFYVHAARHDQKQDIFVCHPDEYYIKIGRTSNEDTLKRIISKSTSASLLAAGSSCLLLCKMILYACAMGFVVEYIQPIKTVDSSGVEKAGLKVYMHFKIIQAHEPLYNMSDGATVPTEAM